MLTVLISLAIGAVVGWIITIIFKSSHNFLRNILTCAAGAVIGGLAVTSIGFTVDSWVAEMLMSAIGACLFFVAIEFVKKTICKDIY